MSRVDTVVKAGEVCEEQCIDHEEHGMVGNAMAHDFWRERAGYGFPRGRDGRILPAPRLPLGINQRLPVASDHKPPWNCELTLHSKLEKARKRIHYDEWDMMGNLAVRPEALLRTPLTRIPLVMDPARHDCAVGMVQKRLLQEAVQQQATLEQQRFWRQTQRSSYQQARMRREQLERQATLKPLPALSKSQSAFLAKSTRPFTPPAQELLRKGTSMSQLTAFENRVRRMQEDMAKRPEFQRSNLTNHEMMLEDICKRHNVSASVLDALKRGEEVDLTVTALDPVEACSSVATQALAQAGPMATSPEYMAASTLFMPKFTPEPEVGLEADEEGFVMQTQVSSPSFPTFEVQLGNELVL